jgi:hypothetical protein
LPEVNLFSELRSRNLQKQEMWALL